MDEIVWEEPPTERTRGGGKWQRMCRPLHDRPGEWARLMTFDEKQAGTSAALSMRRAGYEATCRRLEDDTYGVWARYAPKPKAVEEAS